MPRIPLLGGSYKQPSVIAGAQRCVNLYPEINSQQSQAPVQITHYSRPGLVALSSPPVLGQGRALYVTTLGDLYAVVDRAVYYIDPDWRWTQVGSLFTVTNTPVSIADNGKTAFLVDGDFSGSQIDLPTRTFSQITDPNFLGSTRADFLDSFVVFNEPNTPNWYCTESNSNVFNGLFFGTKTAWPDNVQTIIVNERYAWIMGRYKSEVWQNAGLVPFPFALVSGSIVEHGVAGAYAVTRQDVNIYWLSESVEGARMAMRGAQGLAERISTHAIEKEWLDYPRVDDCICTAYQIRGHAFIFFDFPTADRTWVFDEATREWHEQATFDTNGVQHRMRSLFKAYAYNTNIAQDWNTGQIYRIDENAFTDAGTNIVYQRGFPHLIDEQNFARLTVWRVIADMECGTGDPIVTVTRVIPTPTGLPYSFIDMTNPLVTLIDYGSPVIGTESIPVETLNYPQVWLKISRDRGNTFFTHSMQQLGIPGPPGYFTRPTFNRCGYAYDMVPMLEWTGPVRTALNGVVVEIEDHPGDL